MAAAVVLRSPPAVAAAVVWRGRRAVSRLFAAAAGLRGRSGGRPPFRREGGPRSRRWGRSRGGEARVGLCRSLPLPNPPPRPGRGSRPPPPRPAAAPARQLRLWSRWTPAETRGGGTQRKKARWRPRRSSGGGERRGDREARRRAVSCAAGGAVPEPPSAPVLAEQEGAPFPRAGGRGGGGLAREAGKELKQWRDGTARPAVRKRKKMCSHSLVTCGCVPRAGGDCKLGPVVGWAVGLPAFSAPLQLSRLGRLQLPWFSLETLESTDTMKSSRTTAR